MTHQAKVNALWREANGDRARYLLLLRRHGYVYERADGATMHTVDNPRGGGLL